jgi:hypothetical protein
MSDMVIENVLFLGLILGGLERMYTRSLEQVSFIKQQNIGDDLLVKGYEYGLENR